MNERPKRTQESRREFITETVQDPIAPMVRNYEKGCLAAIEFLIQVRSELRADESYHIKNPDKDFKEFYMTSENQNGYFESLIRLLSRAGYSKEMMKEGFFDLISKHAMQRRELVPMIPEINKLFTQALATTITDDEMKKP